MVLSKAIIALIWGLATTTSVSYAAAIPTTTGGVIRIPLTIRSKGNTSHLNRREFNTTTTTDNMSPYATLEIGTPPQPFEVQLDTGSTYLFVAGRNCSAALCTFAKFDEKKSSTYTSTNISNFTSTYQGGFARGFYGYDTVSMAGITIPHQGFIAATDVEGVYANNLPEIVKPEGLLGLGFPYKSADSYIDGKPYQPLLFAMVEQKLIPSALFSVTMGNRGPGSTGELILGGIDSSLHEGNSIYYINLSTTYDGWTGNMQSISVIDYGSIDSGHQQAPFVVKWDDSDTHPVLFDTGTTGPVMNSAYVLQILATITGQDYSTKPPALYKDMLYTIDCSHFDSRKVLRVSLSHQADNNLDPNPLHLELPLDALIMRVEASTCTFGIMPGKEDDTYSILGLLFLRHFYTVFDMENRQIGFDSAVGGFGKASLGSN